MHVKGTAMQKYINKNKTKLGKLLTLFSIFFIFFGVSNYANGATSLSGDGLNSAMSIKTSLSTTADRYWYPINANYGFSFTATTTFNKITLKIKNSATVINTPIVQTFRQFGAGSCTKTEIDGATSIPANYDGEVTFTFASDCIIPGGSKFYVSMNGEVGTSFQIYGSNASTNGADLRSAYGGSGTSFDASLYSAYIYFEGSSFSPVAPDGISASHFISVSPRTNATTTAPVAITITYWTGTDLGSSTPYMKTFLWNLDTGVQIQLATTTVNLTNGSHTFTATTSSYLANGFYNLTTSVENSPTHYWSDPNYPSGNGYFIVGTTTFTTSSINSLVDNASYQGTDKTAQLPCGITDLSGCFKNALGYMFLPSTSITQQFQELDLSKRSPFIYAYQINELRQDMFTATGTGTTTIAVTVPGFGTITFLSKSMIDAIPYTATIKTLLGFLLYIMMAEYIYYRVIRVHDPHTPQ